jgi:hypothetical protein
MRIRILVLSAIWILVSSYATAQVKWVGAGDGISWSDGANWSSGAMPLSTEDVILDNTTILTSYDVDLPVGAVSVTVQSITITPAPGNNISLLLTAANSSAKGLILTSATDAFTLNDGANFINASSSDIELDGNLTINEGASIDVSAGSGSPVLSVKGNILINAGATGAITESGTGNPVIELNGNNQTIKSITGAITGDNLDFVVNTTGTVSLLSSVFLPHALTVQSGTLDIANSSTRDTLGVKGDLFVNGIITESGTSNQSRILLNGTANQNITVTSNGSITGDALELRLNNPAGATLLSDLTLPSRYSIAGGNLTLGNFSLTTSFVFQVPGVPISTNHIITNGSGFLIIPNIGTNVFIFPVGIDATSVNSVEISNGSGLTYSIRVEPGITPQITKPFAAVNRTWTINTNTIAANPQPAGVAFYFYDGQGGNQFDYTGNVDVGQNLAGVWNIVENNIGTSKNPPEYRAVASSIDFFNTPFIVGNHGAILPIDFEIVCKAVKKDKSAVINWNVYTEDNVVRYELEQAVNGGEFKTIQVVNPGSSKLAYSYDDKNLAGGTSIYRIKVVLLDGKIRYSNTVAVLFNTKAFLITSIAPNPVGGTAKMTISSPENTTVKMIVYDLQGRIVNQWQQTLSDGTNVITLQTDKLKAGVYLITANDGTTKTNTVRIIKQ